VAKKKPKDISASRAANRLLKSALGDLSNKPIKAVTTHVSKSMNKAVTTRVSNSMKSPKPGEKK
jgi:hypothetical protein